MNFSETLSNSGVLEISFDGKYIASSRGTNLNIYQTKGMDLVSSWPVSDIPYQIQWSPNNELILTSHPKKCIIQLFSMTNSEWTGKITVSPNGISGVWWCPDSAQVCVVTEFQLRLSVWNLIDMSVSHVKNPKFEDRAHGFTSCGKFMLLAERSECKDYIGIYFTGNWTVVNHFAVDTCDLDDAQWANDSAIIVSDSCILYQLLIYSPLGQLIARHRPYDNGLGIKSLSLSPNGTFLAVGSYDQSIRLFIKISWRYLAELEHKLEGTGIHIYKEEEYKEGYTDERLYSKFIVQDQPVKIPTIKVPKDKPNPSIGISVCQWSYNSMYLASINGNDYLDTSPNCVWIWGVNNLSLKVLMMLVQGVKFLEWSPRSFHLAFCTGTNRLFLWSAEGASVCEVPLESKDFKVTKIKWTPDGSGIVISDKNRFMVAYPKFDLLESNNENYY
jgi:WD40 repeat protein